MYVPRTPHFNDPYDREWMILVGVFMALVFSYAFIYSIVNALFS